MRADPTFRIATPAEYARVGAAYEAWGYRGGVSPEDVLYIAERGTELVAAVRRTQEHDLVLLRGLYVSPSLQRQRIGSRLLDAFVNDLQGVACYCVPYSHLREFYGRAGFAPLSDEATPSFLRDRLLSYRARGLDVLVMRRAVTPGWLPAVRPNRAIRPTAGRRTASLSMINAPSFQATLGSASGG